MNDGTEEGGVVGKLWDAFVPSEYRSLASRIGYDGHQFISIMGQDTHRSDWWGGATLLLAMD